MNNLLELVNIFLHLDKYLGQAISDYGTWTYLLLFLIVFCETGLVVTPFLPGDSLLFAAGALAATVPALDVKVLLLLLGVAAILGDTVNYAIGKAIGPRAFTSNVRFLKREYLERTQQFYEKHGGKTIILARFVPIVRTFAPFVAGVGTMKYGRFVVYNVAGGCLWVAMFTLGGFFFGNLDFVKKNFSLVVVGIVLISVLPMVWELLKARREASQLPPAATH